MTKLTTSIITALSFITMAGAQQSNMKTGDNFSLEGALALFKDAANLEAFEKSINEENNNVNNLDLNGDGHIDYISATDIKDGDTHVIVLSTAINQTENQDVATIGIEKTGAENAVIQIEGDESLFGANTIVEPEDVGENVVKPTKGGPAEFEIATHPLIVNVWFWPGVRFLYSPAYVVWVSPYRWGFYPRWWKPWKPYRYNVFYVRTAPHRVYFHHAPVRRVVVAHRIYAPKRNSSTLVVHHRNRTTVVHKNKNVRGKTTRNRTHQGGRRR